MSLSSALVALKTANTTLNTLIGTKFSPDEAPQLIVFPCVVFSEISRVPWYSSGFASPLHRIRVQFDCYVKSARSGGPSGGRTALEDAVRAAFVLATPRTAGGEVIQAIWIDGEAQDIEMVGTSTESDHSRLDFIVIMQ